jgi:hypothetical protein
VNALDETALENAARSALLSLPEPAMQLPLELPQELRRKYQRRRIYAPTAVAGIGVAVAGVAVAWQPDFGSSSQVTPMITSAPATSPQPPAVIPTQAFSETTMPTWAGEMSQTTAWSGATHAFTVAGSPVFVVGESVPGPLEANDPSMSKKPNIQVLIQRTEAQTDMTTQEGTEPPRMITFPSMGHGTMTFKSPNPPHGCATGGSSDGGTSVEGAYGLTTPALVQLRCWPTLTENIWVWTRLPAGATTIAYVLDGQVLARSTMAFGVGAIRVPRAANAAADQGQVEALTASGDVVAHARLSWVA